MRDPFESHFDTHFKSVARGFGALAILGIVLNVGLIAGLIYFCFWCAKHFGLI